MNRRILRIVSAAVVALFVAGPSSDALAKKPKLTPRPEMFKFRKLLKGD